MVLLSLLHTWMFVGDVLQDVNDDSIPQSLVNRFAEEK